jgi:hypothetical protein
MYSHAIEYGKKEKARNGREMVTVLREQFTELYGPDFTWKPGPGFEREYNTNWSLNRKKQRFYVKDESAISMILLKIS